MKRSKGILNGLVCLLLALLLMLGAVCPTDAAAESRETSDQPVIALTDDAGIQAQADVDCIAGNSYSLSGTIRTYDGTSKITYSSSDTSIAVITSQSTSSSVFGSYGIFSYTLGFTTYKSGTVTIQGISNNGSVKMSKTITVQAPEATSVSLSVSSYEVTVGSTVQASATVSPSLADQSVTWMIQDENAASVDQNGKITGVKAGTTKVTATTGNGLKKSATLRVYDPVTSIALSSTQLSLIKGNSGTLTATVLPSTAIQTITWTSSNTDVATVSSGKVTAVAAGTATITAKTANGKTATCKVTVTLPDATSVSLSKTSVTIAKGDAATITATVKPSDASQSVTWSTSDAKIATVSGGKITGVAVGSATITAKTANGKTATCKVTVTYADAASVSLNRSTLSLTKGDSATLTATVKPSNASQSVTWSTSDSKVAAVSGGKVTAVAAGTATITAKTANGKTAACTVTVSLPKATSVSLNKTTLSLTKGNASTLTATVLPSDASQSVTWSSSNTKVATVSGGKVTAVAAGTATINAQTSNGKKTTCTVTVTVPQATSVSLNKTTISLTKGNISRLTATVLPSNASQSVTWTSSNTKVATVSGGKVTAVGAGSSLITAQTANGKKAVCTVTVTLPKATSVSLSATSLTLVKGKSATLTATVKPSGASQTVTWLSSNSKIASVSGGKVTSVAAGTATITVRTTNGKKTTCAVTVTEEDTSLVPIYRLYSPVTGEHLYTSDYNEYQSLYKNYGWGDEGVAWYAPASGTAVYRLYQPSLQNHLYTTDANEVKTLTTKYGWQKDNGGKPLYYSGGSVSIYRVYNKDLNGMHHLTTDVNEYQTLPKYGWKKEGVALNAAKIGEPITTRYYKK